MKPFLVKLVLISMFSITSTHLAEAQENADTTHKQEVILGQGSGIEERKSSHKNQELVRTEATYPGGESKMLQDIAKNFVYPQEAIDSNISGIIYVNFYVEKDGSISNVRCTRCLGHGLDEAAIKAVKALDNFIPAKENGLPVRFYYSLPIRCDLD